MRFVESRINHWQRVPFILAKGDQLRSSLPPHPGTNCATAPPLELDSTEAPESGSGPDSFIAVAAEAARARGGLIIESIRPDSRLSLEGDLRGADLRGRDLTGVSLVGRDLSGADLSGANLQDAELSRACLQGAKLRGADLQRAEFLGAKLAGADMSDCDAEQTGFGRADLTGANLFRAKLRHATFTEAKLVGADLRRADLTDARLRDSDLGRAESAKALWNKADLSGANVSEANFRESDFREARLSRLKEFSTASFVGADIREVDFTGAYLVRRHIVDQNYLHEFRAQSKWHSVLYWVWWATSDCGRSASRWSGWVALITICFGMMYQVVDVNFGANPTALSPYYYSLVTLTTLGYGDILPLSAAAQAVAMAEAVAGYVALGGLLTILASKMGRRAE